MGTPFSGLPFLQFGVPRPQKAFFSWECTFPGRKDMRMQFFQWTNQSEFGQNNGLTI